jgi:hypothetical protein
MVVCRESSVALNCPSVVESDQVVSTLMTQKRQLQSNLPKTRLLGSSVQRDFRIAGHTDKSDARSVVLRAIACLDKPITI